MIATCLGRTIRRRIEQGNREPLINNAYVEVNHARAGHIDANVEDREPEKEILSRDAGNRADLAGGERTGNGGVVLDGVVEVGGARLIEGGDEGAIVGEGKVGDALREEAAGEAVAL